ncbi:meiotic recombination protein REC8 homolog isoform 2-T2 [Anomaloglossus baeobatrachus]
MFYFPNVLQRHTGCFSTIWLAATKGSRIVKREYLKVNVIRTCQKIVQYILQQVPPPYQGSPIPRLSLYLSAQLSYGVVCVYHRQCDLLIEEVKTILDRLYRAEKQTKIDLLHTEQRLLLPDNLMLMQMLEDAPDPFFGMMDISPELPDPMMIPQLSMLLETSGPEIVRLEKTPPRRKRRASHREEPSHMTSPEFITMKEVEPALLPSVEFGQDLPEVSVQDWDMLLSELPSLPPVETLPEPRRRRIPGESDRREQTKDVKDAEELGPHAPKTIKAMRETETDREQYVEDPAFEADRTRRELHDMEQEVERLKEEKRQIEIQREFERECQRMEGIEREKRYQKKLKRETAHLQKTIQELGDLQRSGAAEALLLEKHEQIKQLKKNQKEKKRQWEAEKLEQLQREEEREREHLQEIEKLKQRLREAEQEIEKLKQRLREAEQEIERLQNAEKERDEKGMEPDKKMRKKEDEKLKSETEVSPFRSSPKSGLPSEMLSEVDAAALVDEVPVQPIDLFPESVSVMQSPVSAPPPVFRQSLSPQLMLPEVPLEAEHLPPVRRLVRKTSLIIDKNTQIDRKVMQEQTSDPFINTQPVVPIKIPDLKSRTAASLLDSPTYRSTWSHRICREHHVVLRNFFGSV